MHTQSLPVKLTEVELRERSNSLADMLEELNDVEIDKARSSSHYTAKIKEIKQDISDIGRQIRTKEEDRDVEITTRKDYKRGLEETLRLDTNKVISTRILSPREMQQGLFPEKEDGDNAKLETDNQGEANIVEKQPNDGEKQEDGEDVPD